MYWYIIQDRCVCNSVCMRNTPEESEHLNIFIVRRFWNNTFYYSYYYIYINTIYFMFKGIFGAYTLLNNGKVNLMLFTILINFTYFHMNIYSSKQIGLLSCSTSWGFVSKITRTKITFFFWTDQPSNICLINVFIELICVEICNKRGMSFTFHSHPHTHIQIVARIISKF